MIVRTRQARVNPFLGAHRARVIEVEPMEICLNRRWLSPSGIGPIGFTDRDNKSFARHEPAQSRNVGQTVSDSSRRRALNGGLNGASYDDRIFFEGVQDRLAVIIVINGIQADLMPASSTWHAPVASACFGLW